MGTKLPQPPPNRPAAMEGNGKPEPPPAPPRKRDSGPFTVADVMAKVSELTSRVIALEAPHRGPSTHIDMQAVVDTLKRTAALLRRPDCTKDDEQAAAFIMDAQAVIIRGWF